MSRTTLSHLACVTCPFAAYIVLALPSCLDVPSVSPSPLQASDGTVSTRSLAILRNIRWIGRLLTQSTVGRLDAVSPSRLQFDAPSTPGSLCCGPPQALGDLPAVSGHTPWDRIPEMGGGFRTRAAARRESKPPEGDHSELHAHGTIHLLATSMPFRRVA